MPAAVERYFVVPHTHWDREWYRPFEEFHLMLAEVVDEVLDTLERDREFASFTLDGQAIVLEDYLAARPHNEARLRALIADGRLEVGPSYVLPDEFLVGGEPLVRNLLIGRQVCERFGGRPSPAGYLPDSFGHPLQLPQILAGFGIRHFLFMRGIGDELDEVGIAFRWLAPDGSEVLALQLLADYSNFAAIRDADDAEARVCALEERFGSALRRADVHEVVLCNGSDHLHIQPQMPAVCAELESRLPGHRFAISGYGDYVAAVAPGELPAWSGELLGSRLQNVLRGVNSARIYLKQANERAEQRLLAVETLAALSALRTGRAFPVADFRLAWRDLLRCQPHDSICGCSCDEVHRDMRVRYESLHRTLGWLADRAVATPAGPHDGVTLFNPLPFPREQVVEVEGAGPTLVRLDGFSARAIAPTAAVRAPPRAGDRIESDRFTVQARVDGTLEIIDRASGRRFAGLHAVEDEADTGDLYNFCPDGTPMRHVRAGRTRVLAEGPTVWELELTARVEVPRGELAIRTVVRLTRGSERIEFTTTVDNAAEDHRLRVVFPVGAASSEVRAEGQFAIVHRPLEPPPPRTEWCEPPDRTQHAVGVVALGPVALLHRGLPEYEARSGPDGAELCLTLLRCTGLISRAAGEIATRPVSAGPQTPTPEGQCRGRHVAEYALRLDADELGDLELLRASQDYRAPFLALPGAADFDAPLAIEGNVVFSCLKGAEDGDGLVLRVFNPGADPASVSVSGAVTPGERLRLDETSGPERADVAPGEIATLRLTPAC